MIGVALLSLVYVADTFGVRWLILFYSFGMLIFRKPFDIHFSKTRSDGGGV